MSNIDLGASKVIDEKRQGEAIQIERSVPANGKKYF